MTQTLIFLFDILYFVFILTCVIGPIAMFINAILRG
jgi:hypothetical protein